MRAKWARPLLALGLLVGCGFHAGEIGQHDPGAIETTISEIVANPQVYEGKLVRVHGRLSLDFEGTAISRNGKGLWIQPPAMTERQEQSVDHREVTVEGQYNSAVHGHLGMWRGGALHVTYIHVDEEMQNQPAPAQRP